ncbi:MAG: alpha/beta hydrolase [Acidobacteriaceae bacterium]|nr:alpha/beta hydrolase [Acidobacteriaceae bacterium]
MSAPAAADLGFIHRFEPAANPAAPPILLLHGTGGDESDLIPIGRMIAPESALLSPRGKVLEEGMARFFRRLSEGVFDQADLEFRTAELERFIERAAAAYNIDKLRLLALGFSNGANIAASLLLRSPHALAGGILIRGMLPFQPAQLPDLHGRHILLLNGDHDPIVPRTQPQQLAALFRTGGAQVTLEWQPAGHALTQRDIAVAAAWLRTLA